MENLKSDVKLIKRRKRILYIQRNEKRIQQLGLAYVLFYEKLSLFNEKFNHLDIILPLATNATKASRSFRLIGSSILLIFTVKPSMLATALILTM